MATTLAVSLILISAFIAIGILPALLAYKLGKAKMLEKIAILNAEKPLHCQAILNKKTIKLKKAKIQDLETQVKNSKSKEKNS